MFLLPYSRLSNFSLDFSCCSGHLKKLPRNWAVFQSVRFAVWSSVVSFPLFVLGGWFVLCRSRFMRLWRAKLDRRIIRAAWGR